ncbi:PAS domain S-box-containing protein [Breoghania corrubedonensis]|uniref:histidine kinase n=1 Tax=Breoghania corrubedonensis TaxID=665038 RepID=A0A2T5VF81_9HYPH|nr:ATP-binding protein [Breoghania corrubedonensis]PTW62400.1 PAS domain S-box-containing protein [Breoghania corrubedonensis]
MNAYGRTFIEISALPAVAGLIAETRPAWVWSHDGRRILWANAAGVRFFREHSMAALLARSLADTAPARRHLERLARGSGERDTLERLRFFIGARAVQLTALARALDLSGGTRAALVVASDTRLDIANPTGDFCEMLADEDTSALLIAADGSLVAGAGVLADGAQDIALEQTADGECRLRIGTRLFAGECADLDAAGPAARLVIANATPLPEKTPENIGAEVKATRGETPAEAEAAAETTAETVMSGATTPQALKEEPADAPRTSGAAVEGASPQSSHEDTPHEGSQRTVATSSLPRAFFPWNRFLKSQPTGEAAAEQPESPESQSPESQSSYTLSPDTLSPRSGPFASPDAAPGARAMSSALVERLAQSEEDLIAEARAAKQTLIETARMPDQPQSVDAVSEKGVDDEGQGPASAGVVDRQEPETGEKPEDTGANAADLSAHAHDEMSGTRDVATEGDTDPHADVEPVSEPDEDAPADVFRAEEPAPIPAFEFDNDGRPVRFVWQMNVDHIFTGVSPELAQVIGPEAADIVGRSWEEVADRLDLDPHGRVAAALGRRDTWSGVTVEWPVTDNPVAVPVDLAALPAFDRFRQFEGYRGFGVCRPADAAAMERMNAPASADAVTGEPEARESVPEDEPGLDEARVEEAGSESAARDGVDSGEIVSPQEAEPGEEKPDALSSQAEAEAAPEAEAGKAEVEVAPRSEAVAMAAAAAATIAGAGLLAHETHAQDPAGDTPEEPVEETPEETAPPAADAVLQETPAEARTETPDPALAEVTEAPQPSASVTELPAPVQQPSPAYGIYHDPSGSMPQWGLPEAANSQEYVAKVRESLPQEDGPAVEDTAPGDAAACGEEAPVPDVAARDTDAGPPAALSPVIIIDTTARAEADAGDVSQAEPAREVSEESDAESVVETVDADEPSDSAAADTQKPDALADEAAAGGESAEETAVTGPAETDAPDEAQADADVSDVSGPADAGEGEAEPMLPMGELAPAADADVADASITDASITDASITGAGIVDDGADIASEADPQAEPDGEADGESFAETVVRLAERQVIPPDSQLTRPEREAFRKIAEALGARIDETNRPGDEPAGTGVPPIPMPIAPRPKPREREERRETEGAQAAAIHPRLLDRLPIGVAIVRDRDVEYANRSLLKLLGYADLEALAEAGGLEALFAPPDEWPPEPAGSATIERALCVRASDGSLRPVDAFMHTVPWKTGSGLMISLREKRDNVAEEASLAPEPAPRLVAVPDPERGGERANERIAELEAILETATDGVIVLDADGRILSVNRSAEALFNASRQMMSGSMITDYLAPESHRSALDYLDGLARNGVASVLNDGREVIGQLASAGGLIPLFMTIGRIGQRASKENAKFCAVLRDITQWKKAEEELTTAKRQAENASSQKSDFLAKISHEIRTPLNAIIGFSEVMMDERFGAVGNERYKDYLKDIHASGSHLLSLINDLLDLSKVEAGKFELAFEAVPINDVLRDCVALMQPQANRDRVIIRTSLPGAVPKVVADPRSVRQIVLNLLSNAIKFNQTGGQVIVSTALEPTGEVVMRVRDTGIGMSRKDIEAALEPFRQLHTARLGGGTGLGLPLTKALVEANRAGFSIDSEPNQGTMVEITFPSQRVLAE